MKMLSGFSSTVNSLTHVVISLLGLGIVVSLLGGNVPFVSGIADNIVGLVQSPHELDFVLYPRNLQAFSYLTPPLVPCLNKCYRINHQ